MELINPNSPIIPMLVDYFRLANAGLYHPYALREALGVSNRKWRRCLKGFVYPKDSLGRKALASVGVTIHEHKAVRKSNGNLMLHSVFLKSSQDNLKSTSGNDQ